MRRIAQDIRRYTMPLPRATVCIPFSHEMYRLIDLGDTAVALIKAGAERDKKDMDGYLAFQLAPDKDVSNIGLFSSNSPY